MCLSIPHWLSCLDKSAFGAQSFKLSSTMPASKHLQEQLWSIQAGLALSEACLLAEQCTLAPAAAAIARGALLQKPTSAFAPRFLRRNVHSTGSTHYPNRLSGGQDVNGALNPDALKAGLGKAAAGGTPVDPILGGELVVRLIDAQVSSCLYLFGSALNSQWPP